jgi:hypothetical protein
MMFYSTIPEVSAERINLTAVILFVAGGLFMTAAFFAAGFGANFGEILAAFGQNLETQDNATFASKPASTAHGAFVPLMLGYSNC